MNIYDSDPNSEYGHINSLTQRRVNAELLVRKNAVDDVLIGDTFNIEGESDQYKINDIYQSELDFFVTIKATKIV